MLSSYLTIPCRDSGSKDAVDNRRAACYQQTYRPYLRICLVLITWLLDTNNPIHLWGVSRSHTIIPFLIYNQKYYIIHTKMNTYCIFSQGYLVLDILIVARKAVWFSPRIKVNSFEPTEYVTGDLTWGKIVCWNFTIIVVPLPFWHIFLFFFFLWRTSIVNIFQIRCRADKP